MKSRGRRSRTTVVVVIGFGLASFFASGVAYAAWSANATGDTATGKTSTLAAPTAGTTTGLSSTSLTINWSAPTTGPTPVSYVVNRCSGTSCTPAPVSSGTCSGSQTGTSCADTGLTAGTTYTYSVTDKLGTNWTNTSSPFQGAPQAFAVVGLVNENKAGGTQGAAENGDKIVVVFNQPLDPGSVCPTTWTSSQTEQSVSNFDANVSRNSPLVSENNKDTECTSTGGHPTGIQANWGTDTTNATNSAYTSSSSGIDYSPSTLTYCPTKNSTAGDACNDPNVTGPALVLTLGNGTTSSVFTAAEAASFTPSTSIKNSSGTAMPSGTTFTQTTAVVQF